MRPVRSASSIRLRTPADAARRAAVVVGALLLPWLAWLAWADAAAPQPARPAAIRQWILQFDATTSEVNAAAYRSLVQQLPPGAHITVAVARQRDAAAFRAQLDLPSERLEHIDFLVMGQPVSPWPRDRYLFFERHGQPTLLLPDVSSVTSARRGDLAVGEELAREEPSHRILRTRLALEGGDLVIGERLALVGAWTVAANSRRLAVDTETVRAELAVLLGRRIVIVGEGLPDLPHEHVDMYVHLLDDRTLLVGDPRAALAAWDRMEADLDQRERLAFLGGPSREEQRARVPLYEAIARDLRGAGFRVERVPAVHVPDGDVVLTWTNAVVDVSEAALTAYVPAYGLRILDEEAQAVWTRLGCRVVPIDVGIAIREGGAIRCLTNEIRVGARAAAPTAPAPLETTIPR